MPIASTDITYWYSGGAANADPNASLGGAISSTAWAGGSAHDLFDVVTGDENAGAVVDYRCIYVRNDHATLTLLSALAWFSNVVALGANIEMGLDPAGVGGTAVTIADELTAPVGVTFSLPTAKGEGLAIGDLAPAAYQAIWFRRTATNSDPLNNDGFTVRVEGDTAE